MFDKTKQMKRLFTKVPSSIWIFVLIVILFVANNVIGTGRSIDNSNHWLYRTLTQEEMRNVNDSMPAYLYKKFEDSIRNKVSLENADMISPGEGWGGYSLGTSTEKRDGEEQYFLYFSGYKLIDHFTYFFKKDGKIFMTYTDSTGIIKTKPSQIKYINDRETNTGEIFIPTSHATIRWLNFFHLLQLFILIVVGLGIFINIPFRVLYNIAKGNAFNDENIGGLHLMAWVLILLGILPGLTSFISYLIIRTQIPDQVQYRFFRSVMYGWGFVVSGLAILLLAKAFQKGFELQEAQELTI
jgi:hypothetical protein